jgi:excisionase family DNA binding protein
MSKHLPDNTTGLEAAVTTNGADSNRRRNSKRSTKDALTTLSPEIRAAIEAAVKRLYVDPNAQAFSIEEFCARYGVGRQLAYDEINAGRLVVKKAGRRTLIHRADAERWLERLPGFKPAVAVDAA